MSKEVEGFDQARADRLIWKHIGRKPVSEIAKMSGMKPEEVLRRKNEMLEETDVLTIQQKRQKLLMELDEMAAHAREKAESISSEFYAGTINASVSAIKTMLTELNRMESKSSGEVEKLNSMRLQELMRLMDKVVFASTAEIADRYELDEDELQVIFQEKLVEEARRLDEE